MNMVKICCISARNYLGIVVAGSVEAWVVLFACLFSQLPNIYIV